MISFDCALDRGDFSLDVAFEVDGGITALFGPSGSGKSTVIRLLAGLESPQRGRIAIAGTPVLDTGRGIRVPTHRRRIGLVFQDAQLFPHLSVRNNLTYGRWFTPKADRRIALDPVVAVLGIGHLLERHPATLSGGERQRVAIGRALLTSPELLLMDEPLAALDISRKLEILPFIEKLRDEFAIPIVYVSHALEEVARLAARVIRIEAGRVTAQGTPVETLGAASLSGTARFDTVSILTAGVDRFLPDYGVTVLTHPAGEIIAPGRIETTGAPARIVIRATNVTLARGRPGDLSVRTALTGRILEIATDNGPFAQVKLELTGGETLKAYATRLAVDKLGLTVGDEALALIKAVSIDERGVPGLQADGRTD